MLQKLPESLKFPSHEDGSGELSVRVGSQNVNISALVADIEDSAIFLVGH